ncbi:MAG: hypothetical protein LH702_09915 [Phormidesmis sp. CAN_BIN44]|nr:hypothetical protein [Phormidesmis sp. CAN_BIN44]
MTTRIVLDSDIRSTVDQIQAVTKSPSPSHAIALLVSRYGKHLIGTWEVSPEQPCCTGGVRLPDQEP